MKKWITPLNALMLTGGLYAGWCISANWSIIKEKVWHRNE